MTSIQTPTTQPAAPTPKPVERHDRVTGDADFGNFFAHYAQQSSLKAARNGAMALQIGSKGMGNGIRGDAQQLQQGRTDRALGVSELRDRSQTVNGSSRERLSDRIARSGRDRGVPDRQAQRIGGWAKHMQDANTASNESPRATAKAAGHATGTLTQAGGAAGSNADSQAEGNPVQVASGGGSAHARPSQGASTSNNAVSSIHAGSNTGPSSQQGATTLLLNGGQSGQARTQAAASQRSSQAPPPAPTQEQTTTFRAQLAQGLSAALRSGRGQVTLRLQPHTLGELQVRIQIKGSTVDAQIRPSTIEAHRLLEQSVDALRNSFEARGLQIGRIEVQQPTASKEGSGGATHQGQPDSQDGQFGMGRESEEHLSKDSTAERATMRAGGSDSHASEAEEVVMPVGYGSPGIVYSVADGAARIVMIDALA